jgi:hypothetical protein
MWKVLQDCKGTLFSTNMIAILSPALNLVILSGI